MYVLKYLFKCLKVKYNFYTCTLLACEKSDSLKRNSFSTQNLVVCSVAQVCADLFPIWHWKGQVRTAKYKIRHSDTNVHSVSSVEVCCVFPLPASQAIHTGCGQPSLPFRSRSNQGPHLLCLLAWSEVQHPFFSSSSFFLVCLYDSRVYVLHVHWLFNIKKKILLFQYWFDFI